MGRIVVAALIASAVVCAQEPTFRVDTQLVRMLVNVKNPKGEVVGDLTANDFTITDNGVPQEIAVFDRQSTQPLSVALLVDNSGSTIGTTGYKRDSVSRFLRSFFKAGLPEDRVGLFSFDSDVMLNEGFSRNVGSMERALRSIKPSGGTALYDALYLASDRLEKRGGRHVIIAVSDGGDTSSRIDFHQALRAMHSSDAVFYAILVSPITADAGRNLRGENALITLTQWTGGKVFFPTAGPALDRVFEEILRDLRTQYYLGFYPKNVPASKDPFHKVEVKTSRPDLLVSARNGYYAETGADDQTAPRKRPAIR